MLPAGFTLSGLTNLSVNENSANGTVIGEITANVPNSTAQPSYAILSQTPSGAVGFNGNEIVVDQSSKIDYESTTEITGQIETSVGGAKQVVDFTISINNVNENISFPDPNFKAALVANTSINTNRDSDISESEASSFTGTIAAQSQSISSVEGIQYFTNATRIALFNNSISEIDLSKNTKVTQLLLENNSLMSIDISKLTALIDFKAHTNNLTEVNLANGNNSNMTRMQLQSNSGLTCIQVDQTPVPSSGWLKDSGASYSTNCN